MKLKRLTKTWSLKHNYNMKLKRLTTT